MKKIKLTKEQIEAQERMKVIEKTKSKLPPKEKDILKWTMPELRAYILSETTGMGTKKKLKFAHDVMKRIEEEKLNKNKMEVSNEKSIAFQK